MGNCNNCDCNEADRLREFDDNVIIAQITIILLENWANVWDDRATLQEERLPKIFYPAVAEEKVNRVTTSEQSE